MKSYYAIHVEPAIGDDFGMVDFHSSHPFSVPDLTNGTMLVFSFIPTKKMARKIAHDLKMMNPLDLQVYRCSPVLINL